MKNQSDDDQPDDIYDSQTGQMSVINDWWRHLLSEKDLESVMPSNKLRTMFNIIQMCEEKGEKWYEKLNKNNIMNNFILNTYLQFNIFSICGCFERGRAFL